MKTTNGFGNEMRTLGIVLAAGRSSRLFPATLVTTKQLLPIYDKPLIFYPLSLLMLAGINDIVVITSPSEQQVFSELFLRACLTGSFKTLEFLSQAEPKGIPDAFNIVKKRYGINFLKQFDNIVLILGDNIFHGAGLRGLLDRVLIENRYATVFGHKVSDLHRFGVATVDKKGEIISITEKPVTIDDPKNSYALTGLYSFPIDVFDHASKLVPSTRGETEIVDLIKVYHERGELGELQLEILPRGVSWFDTGTPDSLLDASHYVKTIQTNQGQLVGSPHEIAVINGWMSQEHLRGYVGIVDRKSDYSAKLSNYLEG